MFNNKKIFLPLLFCLALCACATLRFSKLPPYQPTLAEYNKVDLVLVLGGGGAKGLAHVGVIEELAKHNIKPDLIIGCSAGAIVGALYADSLDINHVKTLLLARKRSDLLSYGLSSMPFGLANGFAMRKFLKANLHARDFAELKLPFIAVATNLQYGNLSVFGSGKLVPAVLSSAAYPGVFYPIKINGQYFVDGGVASPVPVNVARMLHAKTIIAVNISGALTTERPNHLFGIVKRSLEISYFRHIDAEIKDADLVIDIPFKDVGTFTDTQNQQLYQAGVVATQQMLPKIQAVLASKNTNTVAKR